MAQPALQPTKHCSSRPAFETEALQHLDYLYGLAMRLSRNGADAEDLVQETVLRAYRAWERFTPAEDLSVQGSGCRAWLARILTNAYISRYRRGRTRRKFALEHHEPAEVCYGAPRLERARDPEASYTEPLLGDEVLAALGALSEDHRQIVLLVDVEGMPYRDVAAVLGVPVGTVMSRLFRARRQLEGALRDFAARDYGIRKAA